MDIVTVQNLKKYFGSGPRQVRAVDGISLSIEKGKLTAVIGASGSGKTTLLNLIGGLYKPTEGTVIIDGVNLGRLQEEELTIFRRRKIGLQPCAGADRSGKYSVSSGSGQFQAGHDFL